MKSERRHNLETNELAKRMSTWGDRVRPYSTAITVTAVAVLAVVLITLFVRGRIDANRRAAWDTYTYAMTSANTDWDSLRAAAEEDPDSKMSEMANITWADAELRQATELFFRDQAAAESHLDNARDAYRQLIDESDDPAVVNRARLGMARLLETNGEVAEAQKLYETVEGPFREFAQQRSKDLAKADVQETVTWLATAEMPEVQAPVGPGTPGLRPPFGSDFNLDPPVPSGTPLDATGMPAGSAAGSSSPLSTGGVSTGESEGLDFENPFDSPSDPDRYATPLANGATSADASASSEEPAAPLPTDPSQDQGTQQPAPEANPTPPADQAPAPVDEEPASADE